VTLSSGVAIGGQYGLGIFPGLFVLVSSGSFSSVTVATVSIPSSQYSNFVIVANLKNVTGGNSGPLAKFNGDIAAHYTSGSGIMAYTGLAASGCSGATYQMSLQQNNNIPANGWDSLQYNLSIGDSSHSNLLGNTTYVAADGDSQIETWGSGYSGGIPTSFSIWFGAWNSCSSAQVPVANGLTGTIYVFALPF
jgi:hypothetical protein